MQRSATYTHASLLCARARIYIYNIFGRRFVPSSADQSYVRQVAHRRRRRRRPPLSLRAAATRRKTKLLQRHECDTMSQIKAERRPRGRVLLLVPRNRYTGPPLPHRSPPSCPGSPLGFSGDASRRTQW